MDIRFSCHPDAHWVEEDDCNSQEDDEGVSKVAEGEELNIDDINDLSDEDDNDQYTSENC
ncbi:hypothetical protein PGTUg99_016436 [Puccinia graminis f. sp. tritici]|nr:hypothetical protein PGTUg99_016436 [Puccinia graminis f. sp. tritici]